MNTERLTAIQRREHLTDRAMAERLGISRSAWNMIRNGKMALTSRVQMRAAGAFPELLPDLLNTVTTSAGQAA